MSKVIGGYPDLHLTWALDIIGEEVTVQRARSSNHSLVYELSGKTKRWFLKIDGRGLFPEAERLKWLGSRLLSPQVIGYATTNNQDAILITALEGRDLARLTQIWTPDAIITGLCTALRAVHQLDTQEWPFEEYRSGEVIVHGDACLPNFIFNEDGAFGGCIDVGSMRLDNATVDLAAAVWSLDFNLGSGHGLSFLRQYGISNADEVMVDKLRLTYERNLGDNFPTWR